MSQQAPLKILGAPGSPYSRKLRAVLRYRRIPYQWIQRDSKDDPRPDVPVPLLPVLVFPDGKAAIDSTPLIARLDAEHAERRVLPPDPVVAFLDALLEDYADEWLTKAMFHYRWAYEADIQKAGAILPLWRRMQIPDDAHAKLSKTISERQIERLWVVGSNETTGPVIEGSYRRLLDLLEDHLRAHAFAMGGRPGASDFGLYGQLVPLTQFDPTPMALAYDRAPRVCAWVDVVEDLSGLGVEESDWMARDAVPDSFRALLAEVGRVYAPFLLGNAEALEKGAERVECTVDGQPWVQKPFPYQGKCLAALRARHGALSPDDRGAVDALLAGTGCEALFRT